MIASSSGAPFLEGLRRLLRNQWFVALAILVTAMAVRWEFNLWHPHPTGFFIYHGSPISDGSTYTFKAINIAQGLGIPTEQQPAIRPLYSIVLACVYTWTGFSLGAISALNIIIGGATAALIYLCGALVFNRLCAFGAALFFAIDPTQLIQTPQAGTEPLGLLFFVGSVYAALLAFKKEQGAIFFFSGLLIGLSNLTRTLTAFTLPFYMALILVVGWRERAAKAACLRALLMFLGFSCVMLPWLIRQERVYGIASLSDNIGEAIYAATSPVYNQWTPAVRKDAEAAGIPNTVGDRYRFFIDRAVQNTHHKRP
jgi:4-amino-4-deoxy-L-arabinose transferase-like glycosyltransferase